MQVATPPIECSLPDLLKSSSKWGAATVTLKDAAYDCTRELSSMKGSALVRAASSTSNANVEPLYSLQTQEILQMQWLSPQCLVQGGTVCIPSNSQLVICGSSTDLTLQGVTIKGVSKHAAHTSRCSYALSTHNNQICHNTRQDVSSTWLRRPSCVAIYHAPCLGLAMALR